MLKRKTEIIEFNSFMDGSFKEKKVSKNNKVMKTALQTTAVATLFIDTSGTLLAADVVSNQAWSDVYGKLLEIADWLCIGVIGFAGGVCMFGNKTRTIELLIGCASGYMIVRNAQNIQQWLASVGG